MKKSKPIQKNFNHIKKITAVFSILGLMIVSLGVVYVSKSSEQSLTSTHSRAYSVTEKATVVANETGSKGSDTDGGNQGEKEPEYDSGTIFKNTGNTKDSSGSSGSDMRNQGESSTTGKTGSSANSAINDAKSADGKTGTSANSAISDAKSADGKTGTSADSAISDAKNADSTGNKTTGVSSGGSAGNKTTGVSSGTEGATNTGSSTSSNGGSTGSGSSGSGSSGSGSSGSGSSGSGSSGSGSSGSGSSGNGSSGSGSSGSSGTLTASKTDVPMQCKEYELVQTYMRNKISYARSVPFKDGKEDWANASDYWQTVDLNANPNYWPGEGTPLAYHAQINPVTSVFTQYAVRDNVIYIKSIPTNKGLIDWKVEANTPWKVTDLSPTGNIPKDGTLTAYGQYFVLSTNGSSQTLHVNEYLKRSGLTYANDEMVLPYVNGALVQNQANYGAFKLVTDLNTNPGALPGSGQIIAQGDYVNPFVNILRQDWVRGDVRYKRDVPIENGKPNFAKAGQILAVQEISKIPQDPKKLLGTGEMQTLASFIACRSI